MTTEANRAELLGLISDELAFYNSLRTNGSDFDTLSDGTIRAIAQDFVETVRGYAKIDWAVGEQVRVKLRATTERLLRNCGFPPDLAGGSRTLVLQQAEVIAGE